MIDIYTSPNHSIYWQYLAVCYREFLHQITNTIHKCVWNFEENPSKSMVQNLSFPSNIAIWWCASFSSTHIFGNLLVGNCNVLSYEWLLYGAIWCYLHVSDDYPHYLMEKKWEVLPPNDFTLNHKKHPEILCGSGLVVHD